MIFIIKKIIGPLFLPLSIVLILAFVGLVLLWWSRWQKRGAVLVSASMIILLLCSYEQVADHFLVSLENDYRPLDSTKTVGQFAWVVVLGGGQSSDLSFPATMRLSDSSLARLVEGIRIYREMRGSRLLLSGGTAFGGVPEAHTMALVAEDLGVPVTDIQMETASRDTKDQATNIAAVVGETPFVLVTTAAHMPRSMALFRKAGLDPLPAPTEFRVKKHRLLSPSRFFPKSDALKKVEDAVHEYIGIIWAKLRGQI